MVSRRGKKIDFQDRRMRKNYRVPLELVMDLPNLSPLFRLQAGGLHFRVLQDSYFLVCEPRFLLERRLLFVLQLPFLSIEGLENVEEHFQLFCSSFIIAWVLIFESAINAGKKRSRYN